ncbi:MAG: fatty acid desaturase [Pseudomonadota bacterium]
MTRQLRLEWPTLSLIVAAYGTWLLCGWIVYDAWPLVGWAGLMLATALHSSLVHEVCHGHPTRNGRVNEALVTANPGLIWPYRRFRTMHLQHHVDDRLTDPFDDPESFYRAEVWYATAPAAMRRLLAWSNTLIGRLVLGPPMSALALVLGDLRARGANRRAVARAWFLHGLGTVPVIATVIWLFAMPLWLYLVAVVWPAASIIALRAFAEHRWHETPEGRTIIVEKSALGPLFLYNNLHLVHHCHPGVPWYNLPGLYRVGRDDWRRRNAGYVYPNYWALMRQHLWRAKEPVVHPIWRRSAPPAE